MPDGTLTYGDRNRNLIRLGFANYAEYLESGLWASVRNAAFDRHGRRCVLCGKDATQVHHTGYGVDTLIGNNLESLVPLCAGCHWKVEHDGKGNKRTRLSQVYAVFLRLMPRVKR